MINDNYVKIGLAVPTVYLGKPELNANEILKCVESLNEASIIIFPELCITGYSMQDFVLNDELIKEEEKALKTIINNSSDNILIIGGHFIHQDLIYDVAYVIENKKVLGIVPKFNISSHLEYSENRTILSGDNLENLVYDVSILGQNTKFGQMLFKHELLTFGVEIGTDLELNNAPHNDLFSQAHIIFNLGANTFNVGKSDRIIKLIDNASYLGSGAYVYVSTSSSETSSDVIFTGLIAAYECGEKLLVEENISENEYVKYLDVDLSKIKFERRMKKGSLIKREYLSIPYCLRRF